jgi:hypothetical protein
MYLCGQGLGQLASVVNDGLGLCMNFIDFFKLSIFK